MTIRFEVRANTLRSGDRVIVKGTIQTVKRVADRRKSKAKTDAEKVEAAFAKMMDIFEKSLGEGADPQTAFMDAIDWLHDEADTGLSQKYLICLGDRLDGVKLWVERGSKR